MSDEATPPPKSASPPAAPKSSAASPSQPEPPKPETVTARREQRRTTAVGIAVGGVIGVTLGLLVVSMIRGCGSDEVELPPEAPIKLIPPRPVRPSGL